MLAPFLILFPLPNQTIKYTKTGKKPQGRKGKAPEGASEEREKEKERASKEGEKKLKRKKMATAPPRRFTATSVTADGVAVVSLCREPVNTMDTAFWEELLSVLDGLEASFEGNREEESSPPPPPRVRAAIFSSGLERDVFTAGNDVKELYAPMTSRDRYQRFWVLQNTFLARLFASPLVTVAAWRGATPAAGCCLGLACDSRVMSEDAASAHVGLNEVALGIPVPEKWSALLARVVGVARAERMALFAELLSPRQALESGLVDGVVADREALAAAALAAARRALKFPDGGRVATKMRERAQFAKEWREFAPGEALGAWEMLEHPATVRALGAVIERLAGKKKKDNGSGGEEAAARSKL